MKTLEELAREITRQHESKRDYIADTRAVEPVVVNNEVQLKLGQQGTFAINELAHDQIGAHAKIPATYYDRMKKEAPELLATNIETWFKKYPAPRMFRTLDNRTRAFLSNSFRPLDNFDFANATLPVLAERRLEIMSCDITERRLYLKAVDTQLFRDVPVGYKMGDGSHRIFDTCAPAIILSNSEVGAGRLVVETGVYTRACTNLALFASGGMKRTHLGARHFLTQEVENIDAILSDRTKRKTDEALWLQVRDVIKAAFETKVIGERLEQLEQAASRKITGNVSKVIELAAKSFSLSESESSSVLRHLIEGGSLTQYGLHAAVTRSAQEIEDYDRATEMQYLGGKIIELPRTEWEVLAEAA